MLVTYHSLSGSASPSQTETKSFSICVHSRSKLRTDGSKYGECNTVRCTFAVMIFNIQKTLRFMGSMTRIMMLGMQAVRMTKKRLGSFVEAASVCKFPLLFFQEISSAV